MTNQQRVLVRGVGVVPFGRHLDRTLRSLAEEATTAALKDAGLTPDDVDVVFFSNSVAGITTGQEAIRGQTALRQTGLLGKPVFNVENACASGSSAFLLARTGLLAGNWRRAVVVGAEKMFHADKSVPFKALAAASDLSERPEGEDTGAKSVFMDLYAERTREYMARSGATQDDFAAVVVKNRRHATHNPAAQYRTPVELADVLGSGEVVWPLTRFMCSPISDGAAALVLAIDDGNGAAGRKVEVLASTLHSGDPEHPTGYVARVAGIAYEAAGVGPEEVDVVELHDAASPAELEYSEALGLCPEGGGPELLRSGATRLGGRVPINPGGGLIARGHPVGATGVAQLVEVTLQLRGDAGGRQVEGARIGLVQNAGGSVGGTSAASAVHILART
ncbi:MAG: thiolase family protein [Actinomycetota bacterium]